MIEGGKSSTEKEQPAEWALRMVHEWDYGKHKQPNQQQAEELARLVEAAHERGRSRIVIKRHGQATLNEARKSGVAYLLGGLTERYLPAVPPTPADDPADPAPRARQHKEPEEPPVVLDADDLMGLGLPTHLWPSRLRQGVNGAGQ